MSLKVLGNTAFCFTTVMVSEGIPSFERYPVQRFPFIEDSCKQTRDQGVFVVSNWMVMVCYQFKDLQTRTFLKI